MKIKKHPLEDLSYFKMCKTLYSNGEMFVSEISKVVNLTETSTCLLLKRMVADGILPEGYRKKGSNKKYYAFDTEFFWGYVYNEIGLKKDEFFKNIKDSKLMFMGESDNLPGRIETMLDVLKQYLFVSFVIYKKHENEYVKPSKIYAKFAEYIENEFNDTNYDFYRRAVDVVFNMK